MGEGGEYMEGGGREGEKYTEGGRGGAIKLACGLIVWNSCCLQPLACGLNVVQHGKRITTHVVVCELHFFSCFIIMSLCVYLYSMLIVSCGLTFVQHHTYKELHRTGILLSFHGHTADSLCDIGLCSWLSWSTNDIGLVFSWAGPSW